MAGKITCVSYDSKITCDRFCEILDSTYGPGYGTPGPYFIKVKIFLKSGFKKNWSSLSLGEFFKFRFLLTLMQILYTIS